MFYVMTFLGNRNVLRVVSCKYHDWWVFTWLLLSKTPIGHWFHIFISVSALFVSFQLTFWHTYIYSRANKYLTDCRFVKFSHLQRMERSVIFIIGTPQLWETESKKEIQKITLYDFYIINFHFIAWNKYLITYQPARILFLTGLLVCF